MPRKRCKVIYVTSSDGGVVLETLRRLMNVMAWTKIYTTPEFKKS